MNSPTLSRCFSYLGENGISYSHSLHATAKGVHGFSAPTGIPLCDIAFTVLYHGDNQYGMLVLPADRMIEFWSALDFRQVRELMGLRQIRLSSGLELASLFPHCAVSAVPPFGSLFDMPILLDRELAMTNVMRFAIGTSRDVICMSTTDFMTLVQPVVGSFSGRANPSRAMHAETMHAVWKSHAAA